VELLMQNVAIERVVDLPRQALDELAAESVAAGFQLVQRLVEEWQSGVNRFELPGEALFIARRAGRVVGVCGLNVDPYNSDAGFGRVRHLYVLADHRRQSIGRMLVATIVEEARKSFTTLTLRTNSVEGRVFYPAIGFAATTLPSSTHALDLAKTGL
jgi:GNAT superfamily N-acetyltransferase